MRAAERRAIVARQRASVAARAAVPEKGTRGDPALRHATELADEARDCFMQKLQDLQWEQLLSLLDAVRADVTLNNGEWGENLLTFIEAIPRRAFAQVSGECRVCCFPHPDDKGWATSSAA